MFPAGTADAERTDVGRLREQHHPKDHQRGGCVVPQEQMRDFKQKMDVQRQVKEAEQRQKQCPCVFGDKNAPMEQNHKRERIDMVDIEHFMP